jgi:hypothetical protein
MWINNVDHSSKGFANCIRFYAQRFFSHFFSQCLKTVLESAGRHGCSVRKEIKLKTYSEGQRDPVVVYEEEKTCHTVVV